MARGAGISYDRLEDLVAELGNGYESPHRSSVDRASGHPHEPSGPGREDSRAGCI